MFGKEVSLVSFTIPFHSLSKVCAITLLIPQNSFAYMEMNLLLAKTLWSYDIELVNKDVDWLKEGRVHVLWWKPELVMRFHKRPAL